MKLVFISCYMSPHQKPFCDEMYSYFEKDFAFIATNAIDRERTSMGWSSDEADYIIYAYRDRQSEKKAHDVTNNADVVIIGSAPDAYILSRLRAGKLTFKYSERFYKSGLKVKNLLHAAAGAWLHHGRFQRYPLYMLCASAYTSADAAAFHNYIGRAFKWGYFPEAKQYDVDWLMAGKLSAVPGGEGRPRISILWAGRLIGWKHPEAAIGLAASLKKKGYAFKLRMIGNGEMEAQLRGMIRDGNLTEQVEMLGAMAPGEVRAHMEKADVYLFTSDFHEGWGAVLNEAMNSGCAVVASHAIGAVPFLMKDGVNGLIYENGNQKHLEKQACKLLDDPAYRRKIGENAYRTIAEMWNAQVAASRFVLLAKKLAAGEPAQDLFETGPCSKAEILNNGWYHANES